MGFLTVFFIQACSGPQISWTIFEVLSKDVEETKEVYEPIFVRGCVVPEQKTVTCDAGTDSSLTWVLGGSIGGGVGVGTVSVDSAVEATLGIGQSGGESLDLPPAEPGFVYHYEVLKTYHLLSGRALARSSGGQTDVVSFSFHASCSIQIVNIQVETCNTSPTTPSVSSGISTVTSAPSLTPLPLVTTLPLESADLGNIRFELTHCTFIYELNKPGENIPCPSTFSRNAQHIFVQADLINESAEPIWFNGITAVLTQVDGGRKIDNPIYTVSVRLEPNEHLPLIISVLPEMLSSGYRYQLHLKACQQSEPCAEMLWHNITEEEFQFVAVD